MVFFISWKFYCTSKILISALYHSQMLSNIETCEIFFLCFVVFYKLNCSWSKISEIMNWWLNFWQDYHWWWRSFLTSGFTAVYLFGYCIHYFVSKLEIHGAASTFLYFGYTFIIVFLFFLLTGETLDPFFIQYIYNYSFNLSTFIHLIYLHLSIVPVYKSRNISIKKRRITPKIYLVFEFLPKYTCLFSFIWLFSRYNWFLCLFLVCHQDLRSRQSRLKT